MATKRRERRVEGRDPFAPTCVPEVTLSVFIDTGAAQIPLPKAVLEMLEWQPGQRLTFRPIADIDKPNARRALLVEVES